MEIFFCSHCNQSIPLKDIQSGLAELRRGKYLCATCKEFVPGIREKKPNFAAMYLGIFLVGSLAVIGYLIFQEDLLPAPEPASAEAADRHRTAVLASLGDLRDERRDADRRARSRLDDRFQDLGGRLDKQAAMLSLVMSRLDALGRRPEAGATAADMVALKNRIQGLFDELKTLEADMAALHRAVDGVQDRLTKAVRAAPRAPSKPAPRPVPSETDRWIAQLSDKVADKRFNAVVALSRFTGPKVIAALVGCLRDEDHFIRRFVADELGDRKAPAAAPGLVDALEDEEISVRQSAVEALRKITGRSFGFKSGASARERARAVAKWRNHVAALGKRK